MSKENSKRIAKNTIMLYIRMMFIMIVGLYMSRIILDTLGLEDYGIYNIVGGVVAIFTFLNGALSGATSRFLTFELGKNDNDQLNKVFNTLLTIHIAVALLILILSETIGLWFLEYRLNIPENRMFAARIVYQLSTISCMLQIIQIPYNASIISHERMNVYAYVSVLEVCLKLFIAYILVVGGFDKLILYAILVFLVSLVISSIYRFYCIKNFEECKYSYTYDKNLLRPMLAFSGWDLYGNLSWMVSMQGVNILLNLSFGPAINAASGIASQVRNTVSGFSNNFITAVKPQIVKNYAIKDINYVIKLVVDSSKYSFLLLYFVSFPLILENNFVLNLWLKKVPDYAVTFCQLNLIYSLCNALFYPVIVAIHATGNVKRISFITGTIYLFTLPISYLLLKLGFSPEIPFIISIGVLLIASTINLFILKKYIPQFSIFSFLERAVLPCLLVVLLSATIPYLILSYNSVGWGRLLSVGISFVISITFAVYFIAFNGEMRQLIKSKVTIALRSVIRKTAVVMNINSRNE